MNDNAKLWVEALRSGEFFQGREMLTSPRNDGERDRDCCLGVACKIAIANGLPLEVRRDSRGDFVEYDGEMAELPDTVRDWLGLRTSAGHHETAAHHETITAATSLTRINDEGVIFDEIADIIESEPKGLFV